MVFAGGIAIENVGWSIWIWQLVASVLVIPFIYFYCPEVGQPTYPLLLFRLPYIADYGEVAGGY
jgi:hypothetical protein